MGFTTYENMARPHITVHRDGCKQIRKHGGKHSYGQGRYQHHKTYEEGLSYAKSTALPLILCSFCNPRG